MAFPTSLEHVLPKGPFAAFVWGVRSAQGWDLLGGRPPRAGQYEANTRANNILSSSISITREPALRAPILLVEFEVSAVLASGLESGGAIAI